MRDHCALGIAFFHKQWGTYWSNPLVQEDGLLLAEAERCASARTARLDIDDRYPGEAEAGEDAMPGGHSGVNRTAKGRLKAAFTGRNYFGCGAARLKAMP